jgi:ankyrin repeat protein
LTTAIKRNHIDIVRYLVENNADVNFVAKNGLRAIEYAILPGFYEIATILFQRMSNQQKQSAIQDPQNYEALGKKYAYRYVNYQLMLEGIVIGKTA